MKAITFEEVNVPEFGKPKGWDENEMGICHSVPAYVNSDDNYVCTMWLPSKKDMEAFAEGRGVVLQCHGGMPPVMLYTVDENGTPNFEDMLDKSQLDLCKEDIRKIISQDLRDQCAQELILFMKKDESFMQFQKLNSFLKMIILKHVK